MLRAFADTELVYLLAIAVCLGGQPVFFLAFCPKDAQPGRLHERHQAALAL